MKSLNLFIINLALIAALAVPAIAQKEAVVSTGKIAIIDSKAFEDEKSGIKELLLAYDKAQAELKPQMDEINALTAKIIELEKELEKMQEDSKKPFFAEGNVGSFISTAKAKFEEYQQLGMKRYVKEGSYKTLLENRRAEMTVSINTKIAAALKQFGRQNGYKIILDKSPTNYSAIIEGEAVDVTQEFIRFYNDSSEKGKTQ